MQKPILESLMISPIACRYILSLMLLIVDKKTYKYTCTSFTSETNIIYIYLL